VGNSLISSVDLHSDLQQPEHGNSFSEATTWVDKPTHIRSPTFADFSVDNGVAFTDESDQLQFDYFDGDQMQTMELTHIRSPSFADFLVDNGLAITDESNQLQFDYFDSDQMQTQVRNFFREVSVGYIACSSLLYLGEKQIQKTEISGKFLLYY